VDPGGSSGTRIPTGGLTTAKPPADGANQTPPWKKNRRLLKFSVMYPGGSAATE
jgi:hypothetical protein